LFPVAFNVAKSLVVNLLGFPRKPEFNNDVYAAELFGGLSDENDVSLLTIVDALLLDNFPIGIVLVQTEAKIFQKLGIWLLLISVVQADFNVPVSLAIFVSVMNAQFVS
jgi:hypothetical protein